MNIAVFFSSEIQIHNKYDYEIQEVVIGTVLISLFCMKKLFCIANILTIHISICIPTAYRYL